ncbi:MAG: VOC family protein [Rhodanobacteraceae bacterium]
MQTNLPPFHLALAVTSLPEARAFYGGILGCCEGRASDQWIDFDFHGHQIVAHLVAENAGPRASNTVDGDDVPIPHFGVVLPMAEWQALGEHLRASGVGFVIEPHVRHHGRPGEQATMFVRDPSGNVLEFKALTDSGQLFAR